MNKLKVLEPKKVFEFFEYISSVPRGSGNTKAVSDLCVKFAKDRKLDFYQDELNNVIIRKPATPGYEDAPIVVLQGHLDMVCAKNESCSKDMATEPIELTHDDTYVYAKDTTLGGDDGIAVAYALAILDSDDIEHPAIEAVFTVDEETGMEGACGIDASQIKGRVFLNIDSEEEGIFTCGCAGGCRVNGLIPVKRTKAQKNGKFYEIVLKGLKGGHSGCDIDKQPASANHLMGRILHDVYDGFSFNLYSLEGGKFDNVITESSRAVLYIGNANKDMAADLYSFINEYNSELRSEYGTVNPDITLYISEFNEVLSVDGKTSGNVKVLDDVSTLKVIDAIYLVWQGVIEMDPDLKSMVRTSQNLGVIKLQEDDFKICFLVRSSIEAQKQTAIDKITALIKLMGGDVSYSGNYPGWKYEPDSKLRELCVKVYKDQYGTDPVVTTIHAGLECGLFADKLKGLDAISIGPNILDIHTPRERLDIASVKRVWTFVLGVLKNIK
ncbi:MAG: aminoacyl-histidine dipeptidase [Lachnospiraceae bacterium]|nr:aminoacyl-histidine dipeptidase [Lachnospiraceae bacterium]